MVFEAVAVAVQPDKDWPDASKVDADKLSQARKIQPGYVPCHPKLTGFQPAKSKPGKNELWYAYGMVCYHGARFIVSPSKLGH